MSIGLDETDFDVLASQPRMERLIHRVSFAAGVGAGLERRRGVISQAEDDRRTKGKEASAEACAGAGTLLCERFRKGMRL